MIGLIALGLLAGAVALTGFFLTGGIQTSAVNAFADFDNCGQSLREGGDVKLRGVLVGTIGSIERTEERNCRVGLDLFPEDIDHVPANAMAQIRAKTVFGEKWVEVLLPEDPDDERLAEGDVIPTSRTIDPLEVETILDTGMPLLEAIDPENLAAILEASVEGFSGHEEAARKGIDQGLLALKPFLDNKGLVNKGITQLDEASEVFKKTDQTLLAALENLDAVNRFTIENQALIRQNLEKAPRLLRELSTIFREKFKNLTALVNSGATIVGIIAKQTDDVDKLLYALPRFNANWIRNIDHVCRYRQATTEPNKEVGDRVPGRCWRVHNLVADSRGHYDFDPADDGKPPEKADDEDNDEDEERMLTRGPNGEKLAEVPQLLYAPLAVMNEGRDRR